MIDETISHYRILEKLGAGGTCVVYKALDSRLDRVVALKFLPDNMEQDAQALESYIAYLPGALTIEERTKQPVALVARRRPGSQRHVRLTQGKHFHCPVSAARISHWLAFPHTSAPFVDYPLPAI